MVGLTWLLWLSSFPWMAASLEPSRLQDYDRRCIDEQHVWCVQQGMAWLRSGEIQLTTKQSQQIIVRVAAAYVALGRTDDANAVLIQMLRKDACVRQLPGLTSEARKVFVAARKQILRDDVGAPVISHTPHDTYSVLREPVLKAKVTDDMKVRDVVAFVRYQANASWERLVMEPVGGDRYRAPLSLEKMQKSGYIAYYITASDCAQRKSYAAGSEASPRVLELVGKGPSPLVIAGGALIAVGLGLLIGGGIFFSRFNEGLKRWENTINLAESETIREQIIFDYGMGWGGIGLGGIFFGAGVAALVAPLLRKKPKDPALQKDNVSSQSLRSLIRGPRQDRRFTKMQQSHAPTNRGHRLLSLQ